MQGLLQRACARDLEVAPTQEAQAVREQVNGFKLDKSHTFSVNMFDEIDRYMRVPDEYEAPEAKHFQPSVRAPDTLPLVHEGQIHDITAFLHKGDKGHDRSLMAGSQLLQTGRRHSRRPPC